MMCLEHEPFHAQNDNHQLSITNKQNYYQCSMSTSLWTVAPSNFKKKNGLYQIKILKIRQLKVLFWSQILAPFLKSDKARFWQLKIL